MTDRPIDEDEETCTCGIPLADHPDHDEEAASPGWDYLVTTLSIEIIGDEFGVVILCCALGPEHCGALVPAHMREAHDDHHGSLPPRTRPSTVSYDIRPPDVGGPRAGGVDTG